ncbi:MAG: RidA family protein [Pseudomonadota bacterium]|nr:RidA family protein [Pseudomonadota bacterium]
MENIEQRLSQLGIKLPNTAVPAGSYVPYVLEKNLLWISGQVPFWNGKVKYRGKVSSEVSIDDAVMAARLCGLNILAQIKTALGNLNRVEQVIKLSGFVNSSSDFTDHPIVINGASDLIVDVFGELGRHTRVATGASSLPLNSTTEVDALVRVRT